MNQLQEEIDNLDVIINDDELVHEYSKWIRFISEILNTTFTHENCDKTHNCKVFAKGGTVLGLEVLKETVSIISNPHKYDISDVLDEFLKMNLIKDWDFTMDVPDEIYLTKIVPIMNKYGIHNEGQTMYIVRVQHNRMTIGDDALFEMSIKDNEHHADLELPMSTMKVEITKDNIGDLFSLAKHIHDFKIGTSKRLDISLISNLLKNLDIIIPEHTKDGLFKSSDEEHQKIDTLKLSDDIVDIIKDCTDDIHEERFLFSHIIQPDRLFYRMKHKNIKKSKMIEKFYLKYDITIPDWLLSETVINNLKDKFLMKLREKVHNLTDKLLLSISPDLERFYFLRGIDKVLNKILSYLKVKDNSNIPDSKKEEMKEFLLENSVDPLQQESIDTFISKIRSELDLEGLDIKSMSKEIQKMVRPISEKLEKIKLDLIVILSNFYVNINIGRLASTVTDEAMKEVRKNMIPNLDPYLYDRMNSMNPKKTLGKKEVFERVVPTKSGEKKITLNTIF